MSLVGWWRWAAVGLLAGCTFQGPSTDGTAFQCAGGQLCPSGFTCVADVCRSDDPEPADAARADAGGDDDPRFDAGEPADAARADAGESDAARADAGGRADASIADAAHPDAPPPDAGRRVLVFGEGDADVRGVTTDTWLDSANIDTARGGASELTIDSEPGRVALVRFALDAIPDGSVIERAELGLRVFDSGRSVDRVRVRVLLRDWSEREATWQNARAGTRWPSAGASGAALGEEIASAPFDANGDRVQVLDTAAVQAWVDDPGSNFGMRLDLWSPSGDAVGVFSREASSDARPYLRVVFR
jgi:hypothetical protein